MHDYRLINNHYIINFDDKQYLIDTGSPVSCWISAPIQKITIDGNDYHLQNRPSRFNVDEINNLVGVRIDGFIGMDIISRTGLTIYKNGTIDFAVNEIDGKEIPMKTGFPLMVNISCNSINGKFIIDTGAMFGYGIDDLFHQQKPFDSVKDYNPALGRLASNIYHLGITIGEQNKTIDVCSNNSVSSLLQHYGALMIANVSTLYNEVCVIDTKKGKLIIK